MRHGSRRENSAVVGLDAPQKDVGSLVHGEGETLGATR